MQLRYSCQIGSLGLQIFTLYPPDTPEKVEYINNFFSVNAALNAIIPQIGGIWESIEVKNPSIKTWAIVGFC